MACGTLAAKVGMGLVSGLVGTAAITLTHFVEMRLRHRDVSKLPAQAVEKTLAIQPANAKAEKRLSLLAHVGYGTSWGMFRALLDALGLRRSVAVPLHGATVLATAMVMLPGLNVVRPIRQWRRSDLVAEAFHRAVYAAAVDATYVWLRRNERATRARSKAA